MEMESVEENRQVDFNEDEYGDPSVSLEASAICDVFSDPKVLPRVGNEYQVEIPPLSAASYCFRLINHPTNAKITADDPFEFLMGLPIPVMRIYEEVKSKDHDSEVSFDVAAGVANKNGSLKSKRVKQIESDNSKLSAEPMDIKSAHGMISGKSVKLGLKQEMMSEMHEKRKGRQYSLVPGSSIDHWSDIEKDSFLLALYIFGKNLLQVKKFIGSKQMGDILSFYYGKFYRSCSYIRWAERKRKKSKRGKLGENLFTGLRQEVLLSRLLPHLSEEDQTTLLEVSKTYREEKMLLEAYVFIVKAKVGLSAFVQAVGIGKGKQDLTVLRKRPAPLAHGTPLANCGLVSPELKAAITPSKRSKKGKKRGADEVPQAELRRDKRVSSGPSTTSSDQASLVPFVNSIMKSVREPAKGMNPIEHLQRSYAQAAQVLFDQFHAYGDVIGELQKESITRAELEKERAKVKDLETQLGFLKKDLEKTRTKVDELNAELICGSGGAEERYKAAVEHFKKSKEFTQMKNDLINHGIIRCMNIMNAYFPNLEWKCLDGPPPDDKDLEAKEDDRTRRKQSAG
ncbi:hypothetical protein ABKV19_016505 [Rosa sericea]